MSDADLIAFGAAVFFIALSGVYVQMRRPVRAPQRATVERLHRAQPRAAE